MAGVLADVGAPIRAIAHHAAWLTKPIIALTALCLLLEAAGVVACWLRPRGLRAVCSAALGAVVVKVVAHVLAGLWYRPRPFVALHFKPLFAHSPNTSFPSTLVAYSTVAAVAAFLVWRKLGWVLLVGAAVVAFGCVYVGVHWVTDVVAGAAIGAVAAWGSWLLLGVPVLGRPITATDSWLQRRRLRPAVD